eukprot:1454400-Prymnesium_polylepis.1
MRGPARAGPARPHTHPREPPRQLHTRAAGTRERPAARDGTLRDRGSGGSAGPAIRSDGIRLPIGFVD